MKLEYKDGEFIDSDKHPYDSAAIFEELKKLGVGKVTIGTGQVSRMDQGRRSARGGAF